MPLFATCRHRQPLSVLGTLAALTLLPAAGQAWTSETEVRIAQRAAIFAPSDLKHQIDKHAQALVEGVLAARESPAVGVALDRALYTEVERAIESIRQHRPFSEIVQRLGQVTHYITLTNSPLAIGSSDPSESRYARDYPIYIESAQPRFNPIFYGEGRRIDNPRDLSLMVHAAMARSRDSYTLLANEYRRVDYAQGRRVFDDRSTAFGISALAYSHSISDTIGVLLYIWLRAGGADRRDFLKLTPPSTP